MKKLKIAFLSYRSKPFSGGQGIYVKYLSKALSDLGHEIDVFSGPPYPDLDTKINLVKIPSLGLYEKKSKFFDVNPTELLNPLNLFEWLSVNSGGFPEPYTFGKRIKKIIKKNLDEYDVIHDNQSLAYELLFFQKKKPLITTIHHPISKDLKYQLQSTDDFFLKLLMRRWHSFLVMQKFVAKRLKKIVVPSNSSLEDIKNEFQVDEKKMERVMNGIDLKLFYPDSKIKKIPFRLVTVASADVPLKGLDYLLEALSNLIKVYPDVSLSIIGELRKGGHTERLIKKLNLEKRVNFFSNLTQADLRKTYCEAELAIIPSLYEGFGFAAIEAMACGIPIISSSGGALPEVIKDTGIIIPPKNVKEIYNAVNFLFSSPHSAKEFAEKGLQRANKKFSWAAIAKKLEKVYFKEIEIHKHANN
ncbi:glycosyltransferase family 4 protein [Gammaproteobacteria bacterium]|nr:glycosyltransferase family 4 protein [Gammaproteobacteria bacterium]